MRSIVRFTIGPCTTPVFTLRAGRGAADIAVGVAGIIAARNPIFVASASIAGLTRFITMVVRAEPH